MKHGAVHEICDCTQVVELHEYTTNALRHAVWIRREILIVTSDMKLLKCIKNVKLCY